MPASLVQTLEKGFPAILPNQPSASTQSTQPSVPVASLLSDDDPIRQVERQLEVILDDLEATGVLQKANCMTIDSLLNPLNEKGTPDEATEGGIFMAVMKSHAAQEDSGINGGDDDDDSATDEPPPICTQDLLQASTLMNRYLATTDHSFSRQMEQMLVTFNRTVRLEQVATLKSTHIGDYFQPHKSAL